MPCFNESYRPKIKPSISLHNINKYSIQNRLLLYAVGVVYFYYLTSNEMSRTGYFDENALMTGLVRREFSNERSITKHAEEIKQLRDDRYIISLKFYALLELAKFCSVLITLRVWAREVINSQFK